MRTTAEITRLMKTRVEPTDEGAALVSAVLARLIDRHYLDDAVFAETYTRLRKDNEKLGARRVRQNLQQKGVAAELIAATVDASYAHTNEEALARQHLERKRLRKPENEKESARLMRRLVAAGFSIAIIYKILREWDVPDEALASLESVEETHAED